MTLNEWFTKIIVLHVERRTDRLAHMLSECTKHKLEVEQHIGLDLIGDGNRACTEGHGAILRRIVENGWQRTLILEDDFEFRFDDSQERFSEYIPQVPQDWFMIYLGGGYGNFGNTKVSKNVVRFSHMKTTSSYGVTLEAAKEMAPFIKGAEPIDELYEYWHRTKPCYVLFPRLVVQYENFSDLQMRVMNNAMSMEDTSHEHKIGMFNP